MFQIILFNFKLKVMANVTISLGKVNDVLNELIIAAHKSLDLGFIKQATYDKICEDLAKKKVHVVS